MERRTGKPNVAIIGAGVIGLSVGWRLAQAGCAVSIFDKSRAGRGASWAAAGMLGASAEASSTNEHLYDFGLKSLALWPAFASELGTVSSVDLGLRTEGTLLVARSSQEVQWLNDIVEGPLIRNGEVRELSLEEVAKFEPGISSDINAAAFCQTDTQVDIRQIVTALELAVKGAGATLHENLPVEGVICSDQTVKAVQVAGELLPIDVVIVAAGFESGKLPIQNLPEVPVKPVKGQIAALGSSPRLRLRHVVRSEGGYLVPRKDGRVLVGATAEEGETDRRPSPRQTEKLFAFARDLLPKTADLNILDQWAGIRPGTPDGMPILGPCSISGLVLATGHYRNGVLWAPATAQAITQLVLEDEVLRPVDSFSVERFNQPNMQSWPIHAYQRKLA